MLGAPLPAIYASWGLSHRPAGELAARAGLGGCDAPSQGRSLGLPQRASGEEPTCQSQGQGLILVWEDPQAAGRLSPELLGPEGALEPWCSATEGAAAWGPRTPTARESFPRDEDPEK